MTFIFDCRVLVKKVWENQEKIFSRIVIHLVTDTDCSERPVTAITNEKKTTKKVLSRFQRIPQKCTSRLSLKLGVCQGSVVNFFVEYWIPTIGLQASFG